MALKGCQTDELSNLVIAHRGVPYFAPEETLPSYLLARELGADYLEADLQRTKDDTIIALHDNNLQRTTNIIEVFPNRADDPVSSFTWDELQQLDAGTWYNKMYPDLARDKYSDLKIISLNQLIDIAEGGQNKPGIYLETKHPQLFPNIEAELKALLQQRGWYQQKFSNGKPKVILQTFSAESLALLHQHFPETPLCYLWWQGEGCLTEVDKIHVSKCLDYAVQQGATIIGPSFKGEKSQYYNFLEPWITDLIHNRGLAIHAYTFDTSNDIKNYAPLCEGQFTNRTDLLMDYYHRQHDEVNTLLQSLGY